MSRLHRITTPRGWSVLIPVDPAGQGRLAQIVSVGAMLQGMGIHVALSALTLTVLFVARPDGAGVALAFAPQLLGLVLMGALAVSGFVLAPHRRWAWLRVGARGLDVGEVYTSLAPTRRQVLDGEHTPGLLRPRARSRTVAFDAIRAVRVVDAGLVLETEGEPIRIDCAELEAEELAALAAELGALHARVVGGLADTAGSARSDRDRLRQLRASRGRSAMVSRPEPRFGDAEPA